MGVTLQQLLELTRQVFTGAVNRAELSRRSTQEQAFVATAIMLAARQNFLYDNNMVRGAFSNVLEALLSAGIVNHFAGEKGFKTGGTLVQAALAAGLYRPTRGRGGGKSIILTPPPELDALLQKLGYTQAVAKFLRDSAAGVEQEKRWSEEFNRANNQAVAQRQYEDHMYEVLRKTEELFGPEGLRDLKSRIEKRLGG